MRVQQADQMVNAINLYGPLFASGNEMCKSQVARIVSSTSYHDRFLSTYLNRSSGNPNCGTSAYVQYGNVIFGTSALAWAGETFYYFSDQPEANAFRGVICMKLSFIFSVSTGCSLHTTPSEPTTAGPNGCAPRASGAKSAANETQIAQAGVVALNFCRWVPTYLHPRGLQRTIQ